MARRTQTNALRRTNKRRLPFKERYEKFKKAMTPIYQKYIAEGNVSNFFFFSKDNRVIEG